MVFFEVYNLDIRQYMGTYFYSFKSVVLKSVFFCANGIDESVLFHLCQTHIWQTKSPFLLSVLNLHFPKCNMPPLPPLPPCSPCLHYSVASVKIKSAKVDAHSLSAYWRNSTTVRITLYIHKCNALGMQPCKTFSEVFFFFWFLWLEKCYGYFQVNFAVLLLYIEK